MKIFTPITNAIIVSFLLLLFSINLLAQPATKDENIHRDPMIKSPGYVAPSDKESMATVVTIGDYDNFKLGVDAAECSITNNPLNPLQYYAVWNSFGTTGGKGYSTNNGFDWTASNPSWTGMAGDVVVTYDSSGNLAYQNMFGSISGAKVAMSSNNGQTWGAPVTAISGVDKNWLAADQTNGPYSNYLISTMTNSSGGAVTLSTNHGVAWSPKPTLTTQSLPGMSVCIGPKNGVSGGAQYIVTNSGSSFSSTYTFYESGNGGQTYTYKSAQQFSNYVGTNVGGRNAVQNMRTRPYPNIAADNSYGPHRGRLYLVYASNNPSGDARKPDIFCRYSDNGASTWSSATVVNDDPSPQLHHNWFPAIWCEKETGRLYISWMDTRDCPSSDSAMIYASYTDDGVTFAANQKISNKKMKINCNSCGGGGTPMYEGDYNGVAANSMGALLAWTDFRDGNFANFVGYFPDFGLRASPAIDTLDPTATFYLKIPSVKLYTDTVFVSATLSGAPGLFSISYPQGNKLWSYPGDVPILVTANGTVPISDYTMTIVAQGSNGTPVHKRSVILRSLTAVMPSANFAASETIICAGKSVNFTSLSTGPPNVWSWSFPGGTPSSSNSPNPTNIVYNTAGIYDVTLTVTNLIGTDTEVKSGHITVNSIPLEPVAANISACAGNVIPDLSATGQNIKWYSNSALTQLIFSGDTFATGKTLPGIYTYYVTQSENGCVSPATTASLIINALPVVLLQPFPAVCANSPAFNLSGGEPAGGLYYGTAVSEDGHAFAPQVSGPGTFVLSYIYADTLGCVDTAFESITVNALPSVTLDPIAPVCANSPEFQLSGGLPVGGIYSGNGVNGDMFDPAMAGTGTSTLSYTYTVDTTGCQNTATIDLIVNSIPVVELGSDVNSCANLTVTLDATIANPLSYIWSPGGASSATISVDSTGFGLGFRMYYVAVTDLNNCTIQDSVKVLFHDCTGIEDLAGNDLINLYPNPSGGIITLQSDKISNTTVSIRIYNAMDKLVYDTEQIKVTGSLIKTLNLRHLANGFYLLKIQSDKESWTRRIVIQK